MFSFNVFSRIRSFIHKPKLVKYIQFAQKTPFKNSEQTKMTKFNYPVPDRDEAIIDDYFGNSIADPYRWLETPDDEKTKEFVALQNQITVPYLTSYKYREQIKEKITNLMNYPKVGIPARHGKFYFQYRNSGLQNQSVLYKMNSVNEEGEVFFDPNTLSTDGTIALSGTTFSEDGSVWAYGLSKSGSDWTEIHFRNVESGTDYKEVLEKVRYSSLSFTKNNTGFFYGGYLHQDQSDGTETDANSNQKLYYHRLGTKQKEDIVVVEFDDPLWRVNQNVSDCGRYLVVTPIKESKNNLLYIAKLPNEIKKKLELIPIVEELDSDFEYVTNNETLFYFRTNRNAPNYRIIEIDLNNPAESQWRTVIADHEKDVLDFVHPINTNYLVTCYLQDVKHVLQLNELTSGKCIHKFSLDVGSIASISGKREHKQMFFSFCSFLTPNIIYHVTFGDNKVQQKVIFETKVGDFKKDLYNTKQVFYTSKDGTRVPMFLVGRKEVLADPSGNNPCLLYGYGGFNVNFSPNFAISRLVFINNFDGVYALANIRGGGEYGDKWHNGGRFGNKQNCFDDFQYAAKYLVENNYTKKEKLIIQGGSNGGLLVAACINQAPELFAAAICQVGLTDMLRYHKFTIGYAWKSDYGCSDEEDQFKYLIKYSPLHNIFEPTPNKQYPATLLLTADHDDRVVPLHSLKFIAELQRKAGKSPNQQNPLMIRIETKAGHGAGKPTTKVIDENTDIFCFIAKSLNLEFKED